MQLAVASHYAKALADLVACPNPSVSPHHAVEQIRDFEEMLARSSELRHVLLSPAISSSRKRAIIARFAPDLGLAALVCNFLCTVIDHRRVGILREIRQALETELDTRLGIVRAAVTSARELTGEQRQALQTEFSQLTGRQMRMEYSVDGSLLGGVTAKIGSTVYDGSMRGQLSVLQRRLAGE